MTDKKKISPDNIFLQMENKRKVSPDNIFLQMENKKKISPDNIFLQMERKQGADKERFFNPQPDNPIGPPLAPSAMPQVTTQNEKAKDLPGNVATRLYDAAVRGKDKAVNAKDPLGLNPETIQKLRDSGFFPNENTSSLNPFPAFNEAVGTPLMKAGDALLRGLNIPIRGGAALVGQTAQELGASQGYGKRAEREVLGWVDTAAFAFPSPITNSAFSAARKGKKVKPAQEDIAPTEAAALRNKDMTPEAVMRENQASIKKTDQDMKPDFMREGQSPENFISGANNANDKFIWRKNPIEDTFQGDMSPIGRRYPRKFRDKNKPDGTPLTDLEHRIERSIEYQEIEFMHAYERVYVNHLKRLKDSELKHLWNRLHGENPHHTVPNAMWIGDSAKDLGSKKIKDSVRGGIIQALVSDLEDVARRAGWEWARTVDNKDLYFVPGDSVERITRSRAHLDEALEAIGKPILPGAKKSTASMKELNAILAHQKRRDQVTLKPANEGKTQRFNPNVDFRHELPNKQTIRGLYGNNSNRIPHPDDPPLERPHGLKVVDDEPAPISQGDNAAIPPKGPTEPPGGPTLPPGDGAPPKGPLPDRAANINLSRINSAEDVKHMLVETAKSNKEFTGARRGKMSYKDIAQAADLMGMTPKHLSRRLRGQALNAEELFAARSMMVKAAEEVTELAARVSQTGSAADKLALAQASKRLVAIQEHVSGATAEAGRALGQMRMMAASSIDIERLKHIVEQTGGNIEDMARDITRIDAPEGVAKYVAKMAKPRYSDYGLEVWFNALLSGPPTHAANVLGNSLVVALSVPETVTAAGISKLRRTNAVKAQEAVGRMVGVIDGTKDGVRAAVKAYITENPTDGAAKLERRVWKAIPSVTLRKGEQKKKVGNLPVPFTGEIELGGKQVRIPGRLLTAEDEFFKAVNYHQELNALAIRQATNMGLKGQAKANKVAELKSNPSLSMMEAARRAAEVNTFTNPLGRHGKNLQDFASHYPAVKLVIPFIRTPVNITIFAGKRSPFAPLFKDVRNDLRGRNGQAAKDMAMGRIVFGSAIAAATVFMAAEGFITGGGPKDPKKRSLLYASGWQPYSIKVGDEYYSYSRLEPLGMIMGISADMHEISKHMSEAGKGNLAALIVGSISKNLTSKTWLRGLSDLFEVQSDPDRYGGKYVNRLAGTLIPTAIAQHARYQDPYLREARSLIDTFKSRIPGKRETLPLRRDVFGRPIKLQPPAGPDYISPIYNSTDTKDPVINEMLRLQIYPSRVTRKIGGVELNAQEHSNYQELAGHALKELSKRVMASELWSKLPDDSKREALEAIMRRSRDYARQAVQKQHPDLVKRIVQQKINKKTGKKRGK